MREIGSRLRRQWRSASGAIAICSMARSTRFDAAIGDTGVKDRRGSAIDASTLTGAHGWDGQARIVERDLLLRIEIELPRNPFHLWVAPRARREMFHLQRDITGIEAGKARGEMTIAFAVDPVAGHAGHVGPHGSPAQRNELATGLEGVRRRRWATGGKASQRRGSEKGGAGRHQWVQLAATRRGSLSRGAGVGLLLVAALSGCKPPPESRHDFDPAAIERGRAIVAVAGCAACHTFPDVDWPKGNAGPSLVAFDGKGPIAGALPNTPANLAAFVRNAPAAKPGSTMPAMPISQREARDVAAYLYGISE